MKSEMSRCVRRNSVHRVLRCLFLMSGLAAGSVFPASLTQLGEWPGHPRHAPKDLYIEGSHAYLVGWAGLEILEVTDPRQPQFVSFLECLDEFEGSPTDVFVHEGRAYIAVFSTSSPLLKGIDVSDPGAPALWHTISLPVSPIAVGAFGDFAYTAQSREDWGIGLIYVGPDYDPEWSGHWDNVLAKGRMAIVGDWAAIPTLTGLVTFDMARYEILGTLEGGGPARAVAVNGRYAYLAAGDGLRVIDLEDITQPEHVGSLAFAPDAAKAAKDVQFKDSCALIVAVQDEISLAAELEVLDVSQPDQPTRVTRFPGLGSVRDIVVEDETVFVADGDGGVRILDVTDPAQPAIVGQCAGSSQCVAVVGDRVYHSDSQSLRISDVTDPANPVLLGTHWERPTRLWASGDMVTLVAGWGMPELIVIDATVPSQPQPRGRQMLEVMPEAVRDLAGTSSGYALVALTAAGLEVVDVRDPDNIEPVATYTGAGSVAGVAIRELAGQTHVFLATDSGLEVLEFIPPSALAPVGSWGAGGLNAQRVTVAGDRAALANAEHIWLIDVSDVTDPQLLTETTTTGPTSALRMVGDRVFAGSAAEGLQIYSTGAVVVEPHLRISRVDQGHALLEWPEAGAGWILQFNNDVASEDGWQAIAGTETVTEYPLTFDPAARFFRLQQAQP